MGPVTKSAMMSPVLFLLPILLCVAQAEPDPKSDWFLIDTVDNEESGQGAKDYQGINIGWGGRTLDINPHHPWWGASAPPVHRNLNVVNGNSARDPCISVKCGGQQNVFNNVGGRDYQISSSNSVKGCCNNNQNIVGNVNGR